MRVGAGTHRGQVSFPRSGAPGAPITVQCESGARLDGGQVHDRGWVRALEVDPAGRVWKKVVAFPGDHAEHLVRGTPPKDHYILKIADARDAVDRMAGCTGANGNWATCTAGQILRDGPWTRSESCCAGPRNQSWDGVEGMFAVDLATNTVYLRFADNSEPNGQLITMAPRYSGVLTLRDRAWIQIRGCQIAGGNYGVLVERGSNVTIEGNAFRHGRANIFLLGGDSQVIRNNTFTLGYRYPLRSGTPLQWRIWTAMRSNSDLPRVAILQYAPGRDHRLHGNTFTEVFDGIADRGCNQTVGHGDHTLIYGNTFASGLNDGANLQCPAVGRRVFDNVITHFNTGFRLGVYAGGDTSIYRNTVFSDTTSTHEGSCVFLFREASGTQNVYHNTCTTNRAVVLGSTDANPEDGSSTNTIEQTGWPRTRFVSNIFSSAVFYEEYYPWSARFAAGAVRAPLVMHNWIGGAGMPSWLAQPNVLKPGVRLWASTVVPSGPLAAREPQLTAREMAWDVTTANATLGTPYVGFSSRYYPSTKPDAGAVQR